MISVNHLRSSVENSILLLYLIIIQIKFHFYLLDYYNRNTFDILPINLQQETIDLMKYRKIISRNILRLILRDFMTYIMYNKCNNAYYIERMRESECYNHAKTNF